MVISPVRLRMSMIGYDHHSHAVGRFDVISEALALGRQRAAAMIAQLDLAGPCEEPAEDGVLLMGQVVDGDGKAASTEPQVWEGLEVTPGVHSGES